jgi:hypothetical protein
MNDGMLNDVNEVHLVKYGEIIGSFPTKTNHCISKLISSLKYNKLKVFYQTQSI